MAIEKVVKEDPTNLKGHQQGYRSANLIEGIGRLYTAAAGAGAAAALLTFIFRKMNGSALCARALRLLLVRAS